MPATGGTTGEVSVYDGRAWVKAAPGDFLHVPPGGLHGFHNESGAEASMLLRRVHRTGLIACVYRAAEWRHKKVELAAHELLQELDRVAAIE